MALSRTLPEAVDPSGGCTMSIVGGVACAAGTAPAPAGAAEQSSFVVLSAMTFSGDALSSQPINCALADPHRKFAMTTICGAFPNAIPQSQYPWIKFLLTFSAVPPASIAIPYLFGPLAGSDAINVLF